MSNPNHSITISTLFGKHERRHVCNFPDDNATIARYGWPGGKLERCAKHALPGMINLRKENITTNNQ